MKALEVCYEIIDRIVFEMDFEKFLLYVRSALGRLAGNIVNREMSNQIYKIWLKK